MFVEWTLGPTTFKATRGDITAQDTEAVVNAANKRLAPGGGVAGAIHREAGEALTEHCRERGNCETGEAVITPGFELEADHIIHTVGPVYHEHSNPSEALRDSYYNSLALAKAETLDSISFPLLSTGAFGYPVDSASEVAVETVREFLEKEGSFDEVRFVLWGEEDHNTFCEVAEPILGPPD